MSESTITSKGQTTVPREIREALGAGPGTRLAWHLVPGGTAVVRAKSGSVRELAGVLGRFGTKRVAIRDMDPWR